MNQQQRSLQYYLPQTYQSDLQKRRSIQICNEVITSLRKKNDEIRQKIKEHLNQLLSLIQKQQPYYSFRFYQQEIKNINNSKDTVKLLKLLKTIYQTLQQKQSNNQERFIQIAEKINSRTKQQQSLSRKNNQKVSQIQGLKKQNQDSKIKAFTAHQIINELQNKSDQFRLQLFQKNTNEQSNKLQKWKSIASNWNFHKRYLEELLIQRSRIVEKERRAVQIYALLNQDTQKKSLKIEQLKNRKERNIQLENQNKMLQFQLQQLKRKKQELNNHILNEVNQRQKNVAVKIHQKWHAPKNQSSSLLMRLMQKIYQNVPQSKLNEVNKIFKKAENHYFQLINNLNNIRQNIQMIRDSNKDEVVFVQRNRTESLVVNAPQVSLSDEVQSAKDDKEMQNEI